MTEADRLRKLIAELKYQAETIAVSDADAFTRAGKYYLLIADIAIEASTIQFDCDTCHTPMKRIKDRWHCEGCGRNRMVSESGT